MYKDTYRHTLLGNPLASGLQLGTGDHVSVGPDLAGRSAASRCVKGGMFCFTIARAMVLRASLGCKLLIAYWLRGIGSRFFCR